MYLLRLNVTHNGVSMKAGSECPAEFVKPLLSQGLLVEAPALVDEQKEVVAVEEVAPPKPKKKKALI